MISLTGNSCVQCRSYDMSMYASRGSYLNLKCDRLYRRLVYFIVYNTCVWYSAFMFCHTFLAFPICVIVVFIYFTIVNLGEV